MQRQLFGLGLANAVGMSVIGLLLVLAVRRHAGADSARRARPRHRRRYRGRGSRRPRRMGRRGRNRTRWSAPTPTGAGSLVQGMLGGVVVAAVFVAVAYPLDRRDLRPLAATLARRIRRRRPTAGDDREG